MLLGDSGKITGNIDEIDQGNIEGIAKPDKPGGLVGCIHIQTSGFDARLIGDDANRMAIQAGKADNDMR